MEWVIILAGVGMICCVVAGKMWKKDSGGLFCIIGLIFIIIAGYILIKIPNGLPPELKADGQYKVQPLDSYTDKEGKWIVAHVLEEGGKTIDGLKPYRKIPRPKFGSNNVVIGVPMTIELKTHPSYQELIIKKDY